MKFPLGLMSSTSSTPPDAPVYRNNAFSVPGTGTVNQSLASFYSTVLAKKTLIVICLGLSCSITGAPSSVSIDGNAALQVAYEETNAGGGVFNSTMIYQVELPAGVQPTTLQVVRSSGNINRFCCSTHDLVGLKSNTPVDAQHDGNAGLTSSVNVAFANDGVGVGMTNSWRGSGATGTVVWTNMTEDYDVIPVGNRMWSSGAHAQVVGVGSTVTVTITRLAAAGNGGGLAVATWR